VLAGGALLFIHDSNFNPWKLAGIKITIITKVTTKSGDGWFSNAAEHGNDAGKIIPLAMFLDCGTLS
jgi:hypothetical protein